MADKIEDGGPAFPTSVVAYDATGMTLRDYFASAALTGFWAGQFVYCDDTPEIIELKKNAKTMEDRLKIPERKQGSYLEVAQWVYEQADAMLKARNPNQ